MKRGVSPLIATVLILSFTIILAGIVIVFQGEFIEEITESTEASSKKQVICSSEVGVKIRSVCLNGNDIITLLENFGNQDIDGFNARIVGDLGAEVVEVSIDLNAYDISNVIVTLNPSIIGSLDSIELLPVVLIENEEIVCTNTFAKKKNIQLCSGVLPQCSDSIDNDGDLLVDFPADPGCVDALDNDESDAPDTIPPVVSNGLPTGTLPSGIIQVTMSVDTDESATCRYETVSGVDYSLMSNTFSTTGGISHSQLIVGLLGGQSYNYYIKCIDGLGNDNLVDYLISFSVNSVGLPVSRGYQARGCGLDMNRNGIIGESGDCNVCDGVTLDVDGDGFNEDLYYVDSFTGSDILTCGSAGSPCGSVAYTINNRVDGPGVGEEDIVCIRGTFNEYLTNLESGKAGFYVKPKSGSEETDFQFANNPFMIVGWDFDNDGVYPPFDQDDIAEFDGLNLGGGNINNDGNDNYVELAHFTSRNYLDLTPADPPYGGFMFPGRGVSHVYVHDVEMIDINRGVLVNPGGNGRTFDMFNGNGVNYFAIVNILSQDQGGYFARGSPAIQNGPYRFQSMTITYIGQAGNDVVGYKLWGLTSGIEIIDSIFDAQPALWGPGPLSPGSVGVVAAQCSQDWTIRNNEFIDFSHGMVLQPQAGGACGSRNLDNIVIDRNIIRNSYAPWGSGPVGIQVDFNFGSGLPPTLEDVTITNNFLYSTTPNWVACIETAVGNNDGVNPGVITIAGNTCVADISGQAGLYIIDGGYPFPQQNFVIQDNIFDLGPGDRNLYTNFAVINLISDGNVYDTSGYVWNGAAQATLVDWQTATGQDANSNECSPSFVDVANGDLHLLATDTCAIDAGVDISAITNVDFDGDIRGQGLGFDVGADEAG